MSDHGTKSSYDIQFRKSFAWDFDTLAGYPYRFLPVNTHAQVNSFGKLRLTQSLRPLLHEKHIKVLWVQGWQVLAYWQAIWQAHQSGIVVWLRAESNDLHTPHWSKRILRKFLINQLFKRVNRFFYIGNANRRLYQQFGVPEQKLIFAPYCVDNLRFAQTAETWVKDRNLLRKHWGIPESATCFLFCGKFIPKKRPLDLLEAVHRLVENERALGVNHKIHILFVGEGELRPLLEAKAHQLEAICGHSLVTFAGFLNQTEITNAYVSADCLVLPSDAGETWGLVVNEALACGCPALVSNLCGCAEDLISPLGTSYIYQYNCIPELAQRLQSIIYGDIKKPLSDTLRVLLQKYSIQTVITNVSTAYHSLIEEKPRGVNDY